MIDPAVMLARATNFLKYLEDVPAEAYEGRGITICGGGIKYFTCAWVCIKMLRQLGCDLPVEIWYLGPDEFSDEMKSLVAPLGVTCIDAHEVRNQHPVRTLNGWELKPYSIIHSRFKEVISIDADNVPVKNPEFLFETGEYKRTGCIFWPDYGRLSEERSIWSICDIPYRDEPEFESGQIFVDKERCWKALNLTMHYNEYSDFYYNYVHGDKETFHMAFRKVGHEYSMPSRGIRNLNDKVMCQHDFDGERVFQHRNLAKWSLYGENIRIAGFKFEEDCLRHLEELRSKWSGKLPNQPRFSPEYEVYSLSASELASYMSENTFVYERVGHDKRLITFQADGRIGKGSGGCEVFWDIVEAGDHYHLEISSEKELTCRVQMETKDLWRGFWTINEKMPVRISKTSRV
jgi:hypothetical protein